MTMPSEKSVPRPRKLPSCERMPCEENPPSRQPTTVSTLPELRMDTVHVSIMSASASRLPIVLRHCV